MFIMKEFDSFYNTYNARHLNPKEVAETFIYSENYEKLIQNNHSIILGARGCGKTTLMKMLTLPALHTWAGAEAENIRKNIPFYSIYISTDIYWDVKNQIYSSQLECFGTFADKISRFSVNTNVFKAVCETFRDIIEIDLQTEDEEKEIELCQALIKAWQLKSTIPKLEYIIDSLNERVDQVNQLIQHVIFNVKKEEEIPTQDYFNLSFESSLQLIIPLFERIYSIVNKRKWALCFDELEFAPIWLQKTLFASLRSRAQYILYKLSASPILPTELEKSLRKEYGATPGNDVQMIKMWSSTGNKTFSRKLIDSLLKKKNNQTSSDIFFGTNDVYNKDPDSYIEGSPFYKELQELIAKDDAFAQFLTDYHVDIQKPLATSSRQKDTLFRKIKPIVYFRNFYLESNKRQPKGKTKAALRGRKMSELYSGIEILCKVCDGNPRWLIGIINSILAKAKPTSADKKVQALELFNAARRFKNVIANIPIGENSTYNLFEIINKIGAYFSEQVLGPDFNMDPRGTFVVNENPLEVDQSIIDLIEKGISQGAFILLDSADDAFDFEIRNQRFKFSYLLSILYKLPIRVYPSTRLSECLKDGDNVEDLQIYLFD